MSSHIMRITAVVLVSACLGSRTALAQSDQLLRCEQYFKLLEALHERWGRAARFVQEDRFDAAISLFAAPPPPGLDDIWFTLDKGNADAVKSLGVAQSHDSPALRRASFYLRVGQPALAHETYATAEFLNIHEKNAHLDNIVHAFVLLGRPLDATARLEELSRATQEDSFRKRCDERIKSLRELDAGEVDWVDYLGAHGSQFNFGSILRAYDDGRGLRDVRTRRLMIQLFERPLDGTATRLLLELAAESRSDREDAAGALLTLGNLAYEKGEALDALRLWQRAVDELPGTRDWPKALFNIGVALKKAKSYDRAIDVFERLLDSNVNDHEPGAHVMANYRNYRPQASWEIGLCRLEAGNAAGALEAFRTTREKYPFHSFCGNAHHEFQYRYAAFEGICLDSMGRYPEAIGRYFDAITESGHGDPFAARRLVDLYETCNALNDLAALCDEADAHHRAELRRAHPELELDNEHSPTAIIRSVMNIRALGSEGRYGDLVELLREDSATEPCCRGDLQDHWGAHEAALVLARYPAQALPVLLERAKSEDPPDVCWVYYALGLNAAPEAVALLESKLAVDQNQWLAHSLAFALAQTGDRGAAILDAHDRKIATPGRKTWRESLALYEKSNPDPWPALPPLPKTGSLPKRLAEINEEVRMIEALPDRAPTDRTTPAAAIETWIMALRIGDRQAYASVTEPDENLQSVFDDVTSSTGDKDGRFMQHRVVSLNQRLDGEATAEVQLIFKRDRERIRLELSRREDAWMIVSFKVIRN